MERREFIKVTGLGLGSMMVPVFGQAVSAADGTEPLAASLKKSLADAALSTATALGASYADVRVGRYLRQFLFTRENRVQNIVSTEFWNACAAICDERDYRLGGTFFDGKGEPAQVSAVSHGCSTARFNNMKVINSARSV